MSDLAIVSDDSEPQSSSRSDPAQPTADIASLLRDRAPIQPDALYLHIPFCFHKCHYCDFYSIVDHADRHAAFVDRLIDEMRTLAPLCDAPPRTIFIGGGTPTLLGPPLWQKLLAAFNDNFDPAPRTEFTVEANPETVTPELIHTLVAAGVNRMSIGAQSFNPVHLKTLERWHDPDSVPRAVQTIREAGIHNINLDLIFAIPGQSLDDWHADLQQALAVQPDHLSCYALTYEPNTPLTEKLQRGRITRAAESLEAQMFECTVDALAAAGFEQYEISNFARTPDRRCQHNLIYWRNQNWLALGTAAAGHIDGLRWRNVPHLGQYLNSTGPAPVQDIEQLDHRARVGEHLMMQLRLTEGVRLDWINEHLDPDRRATLDRHLAAGLLQQTSNAIALTPRGRLLADTVIADLL